ncbi:hypothetical protein GCM10020219_054510 [Nonomuraea dietziae]
MFKSTYSDDFYIRWKKQSKFGIVAIIGGNQVALKKSGRIVHILQESFTTIIPG